MVQATPNGSHRGRILVADDEPHIRRILTTLLESASFEVDPVADGPTALEHLEGDGGYDLVLLDIMMPGATGLEVLDRMSAAPMTKSEKFGSTPATPIVVKSVSRVR